MNRTATALACLIFSFGVLRAGRAEVVSLWIEVQGTRCPPCARGLEDAVRRLDGVSRARFGGLAPQKLDLGVKPGEWVDLAKIWELIVRQGYRVRKENTHLVLRGRLQREGKSWLLVLDGTFSTILPIEIAIRKQDNGAQKGREPNAESNMPAAGLVEVDA